MDEAGVAAVQLSEGGTGVDGAGELHSVVRWTRRVSVGLNVATEAVAVVLVAVIVGVVFAEVFCREALNSSLVWSDTATRMLFVGIVFLGAAIGVRRQALPAIHLAVGAVSPRFRPWLLLAADVLAAAFLVLLAIHGLKSALDLRYAIDPATGWHLWYVHLVIPVAAALMLVHLVSLRLEREWLPIQSAVVMVVGAAAVAAVISHVESGVAGKVLLPVALVALLLLNLPVAIALGMSAFASLLLQGTAPLTVIVLRMYGGVDVSALTAVPFFMLAGELMARGGLARRLVDFASALVGWVRGGLGLADIVSSLIFADMSGSCVADTAAIGTVMIPGLIQRGYTARFATALQAAGGSLGMLFPPSITMIIYAWVANVSVAQLFVSSLVPGILVVISYSGVAYVTARRRGFPREHLDLRPRRLAKVTKDGALALITPVIILGGILSGTFSPTEAGAIAVIYTFVVSVFVYRTVRIREIVAGLRATVVGTSRIMFIIACAIGLSWLLTVMMLPQSAVGALGDITHNRIVLLLLINLVLMFLHTFLEAGATLLLVVPVLLPTLAATHIDPTYFGIILVMNSALGLLLPPMGLLLYIASSISNLTLEETSLGAIPFASVLAGNLLLVTLVPQVVTFLPNLFYG